MVVTCNLDMAQVPSPKVSCFGVSCPSSNPSDRPGFFSMSQ